MRLSNKSSQKTYYVPDAPVDSTWLKIGISLALLALLIFGAIWIGLRDDKVQSGLTATSPETSPALTATATRSSEPVAAASATSTPSPRAKVTVPPKKKPASSANLGELYSVLSVTDGDTIRVDYKGQNEAVRLIGIDTPEVGRNGYPSECFANDASNFVKQKLSGTKVHLVRDGMQDHRDRYDRLLRFVILEDGSNFNATLVRRGYATFESQYPVAQPFRDQLADAEAAARSKNTGLWSVCR